MGWCNRCSLVLVLLCTVEFSVDCLTVENGAYKDVLVTFDTQYITVLDAGRLLSTMKVTLEEASKTLYKAIGVRIADVTILLPKEFNISDAKKFQFRSENDADVTVMPYIENAAFGKNPLAVQYGGCGVEGLKINVPFDFLTFERSDADNGKIFAKEWIKYRYGVFDENGFPNDDRYPAYFAVPGTDAKDIRVTDCTNVPVKYQYKDPELKNCTPQFNENTGLPQEEEKCSVHVDEQSQEDIESSLLYIPNLPKVEHVCGSEAHPHAVTSPNKQNALCGGKSILDVIKNSPELKSVPIEPNSGTPEDPVFNYVQEMNPRIVVAFDTSSNIGEKRGEMIKISVRRFLYDLPEGSQCSFVRFSDVAGTGTPLQEVGSSLRDRSTIDSSIKFLFDVPVQKTCPHCAVDRALDILLQYDPDAPGTIVVISSSDPTDNDQILNKLRSSQICLIFIIFGGLGATKENFQNYLSASPCGSTVEIPESNDTLEVYNNLYDALELSVPKVASVKRTETILTSYIRNGAQSEPFSVGPPAERVTLWVMPTQNKDLYSEGLECRTTGTPEQPRTPTLLPFEQQMLVAVTFESQESEELTCSLKHPRDAPVLMQVRSTSSPGQHFEIEAWTRDTTPAVSQDQMPVILYARIFFGAYPVLEADVKAVITSPDSEQFSIDLFDSGFGDPDITRNDGIYSRYFTQFTVEGKYTVEIRASDNDARAQAGTKGSDQCCGSRVNIGFKIPLLKFQRSVKMEFQSKGGRPEHGYKPSRIIDLRVDSVSLPESVTLKWTAPGAEADQGKASRYVFKIFEKPEDAYKDNSAKDKLPDWVIKNEFLSPEIYGSEQEANITFSEQIPKNRTHFLTIFAINEKNQQGPISNLIQLMVSPEEEDSGIGKGSSRTGTIVGSVIGAIILITIIAIAIYVYFIKIRHRKKPQKSNRMEDRNLSEPKKPDSVIPMTDYHQNGETMPRVDSFPVLIYTHDQLKDFKDKEKAKDPPLYKPANCPKWQSLDMLPSIRTQKMNPDSDKTSMDSLSTADAKDDKSTGSNEMKELDRLSEEQPILIGKISKI